MVSRVIVIASIVVAGSAAAAQTPVNSQVSPDALHQVQVFEANLRTAIERAGGEMLKRASQVVPDISLRFETEIRVTSALLPTGEGLVFVVEVPAIEATSAQLWEIYRRMPPPPSPNPLPRVGNSAGPVPSPVVPADPGALPTMTNPVKEYSEFTRQALVDAMLDNAFALPLKDGQSLTLVVAVAAGGPPATSISQAPRKLYLSMKSEDLVALRQNRITRDEARTRISESRY